MSSLKKICDEAVTYEVELLYLPDGVKVGDTVSIVDDDDNTYLTARLLKLETSESNDTKEAELGDYVRQESGIDEKVIELAERFEKIAKNRNFYTWTAFADDENGTGISANAYGKDYLGIATNRLTKEADLSDPMQYTWVKIKGEQGIPGTAGKDGKTTYFHMKYSAVPNPTSYSDMTETPNKYIGTYADYELDDSTDPSKYTWGKFQGDNGEDGADGIPGKNGENGETSYVHFAYATSADGKTGFSTTDTVGKTYMGQYADFEKADSEDPTKYRWGKFQGPKGKDGVDGEKGEPGEDGISPTVDITKSGNVTTISITDRTGDHAETVKDGENGTPGKDAILISETAPEKPEIDQLWQTASGKPIKRWTGSEWVVHYLSVENLDVEVLSAIAANLGTVIAGIIKNKEGTVNFDVEKGIIDTYNDTNGSSSSYGAGSTYYMGKDPAGNAARLAVNYYQLVYGDRAAGTKTSLTPMNGDWWVGAGDPWNGDNDTVLPIYASLNHLIQKTTGMIAGSKVVQIANGKDSVALFTAAEVATLLGIADGGSVNATVTISNGDGAAYGIHVEGCTYQNNIWYACFAGRNTSGISLPVRINYIIMAI